MSKLSPARPDAASFRDPSGQVVWDNGQPFRLVATSYAEIYQSATDKGLYRELFDADLLVQHEVVSAPFKTSEDIAFTLRPEIIPFISYPYEWCFSQIQDAALLTLDIQERAIKLGFSLKDASAYNVQFIGSKPIFIDTLSFEPLELKPWVAYRQFCQHFLAPLAIMSYVDVRLSQLLRSNIDGVPLDLASRLLPIRSKLSPMLLMHLHLHASSQKRHAADGAKGTASTSRQMTEQSLLGLIQSLRHVVKSLNWKGSQTEWADYYLKNNNYTDQSIGSKEKLVADYLTEIKPKTVWDLGGNTGRFSRIAAEAGAATVCWDIDPMAVESLYRQLKTETGDRILPLMQDFANPSPDLGWANSERASFIGRGPADVVMALALVHHLAIGNNLPLPKVAEWLANLCRKGAIVEFIPKEDSQVEKLLSTREDIFTDYSVQGFETAVQDFFKIESKELITGSHRFLYQLRCKRN